MAESLPPHPDMSDYEVAAWSQSIERARRPESRRQVPAVKKVSELAEAANERLENFFDDHMMRGQTSITSWKRQGERTPFDKLRGLDKVMGPAGQARSCCDRGALWGPTRPDLARPGALHRADRP